MMTTAEERRPRKTLKQLRETAPPSAGAAVSLPKKSTPTPPRTLEPKKSYVRRETGLALLGRNGRLSTRQVLAGDRYHRAFALLELAACAPIGSNLNILDSPGGGGGGGAGPIAADFLVEREVLAAKQELHAARIQIRLPYLVGALDVICGKQWTPSMVSPIQREQDEIVTSLRIALDMLIEVYLDLDSLH